MNESEAEISEQRHEIVTAAARLAGRGREARRVVVVLADRPSFDELYEVRRCLNETHSDVAMSVDGDGTLTFRKAKVAPQVEVVRPSRVANEGVG